MTIPADFTSFRAQSIHHICGRLAGSTATTKDAVVTVGNQHSSSHGALNAPPIYWPGLRRDDVLGSILGSAGHNWCKARFGLDLSRYET